MKRTCLSFRFVFVLLPLLEVISCKPNPADTSRSPEFVVNKGVNISHWLSQSDVRGEDRKNYFTEKDVEFIAGAGYDHIRLPVDEEQLWDMQGNKIPEAFALLNNAVQWCMKNKLRIIIDMHILRSHYFNAAVRPLWTDTAEQVKFVERWMDLSDELKQYPLDQVAYELLNEAVADDPKDWNRLIAKAMKALREREPQRTIVIGSNRFQDPGTFPDLKIPENDSNIILSFHFYTPFALTHYKASWTAIKTYDGPVKYPGQVVDSTDLAGYPDSLRVTMKWASGYYTADTLEKRMQLPLEYARKYNLPLYCGEYGCLVTVPRESRLAWYSDMIAIFDKNNIASANWDYKAEFGIYHPENGEPDKELIEIITGKKME
jgi:endoglucanase